jgi:hypothetical protein
MNYEGMHQVLMAKCVLTISAKLLEVAKHLRHWSVTYYISLFEPSNITPALQTAA